MARVAVVMPVAYDWPLAAPALRSVYAVADVIVLGLDDQRRSWAGHAYEFSEVAFTAFLMRNDPQRKVRVLEGDWHSNPDPMANEVAERNALSLRCPADCWIWSLDADERVLDAPALRAALDTVPPDRVVTLPWLHVWKVLGETALIVPPSTQQRVQFATRQRGAFRYARGVPGEQWAAEQTLLHWSYARALPEIARKLNNWGHAAEIDGATYLQLWQQTTLENFAQVRNLHPVIPELWPRLEAVPLAHLLQLEARAVGVVGRGESA